MRSSLGIMERTLVIGASGGIGAALAQSLDGEVVRLSRKEHGFDVRNPEAAETMLGQIEGPFTRVIVALGILAPQGVKPEKSLAAIEAEVMAETFAVNAIGPALILKHLPRWLPKDQRSVVGVLSARVGSIGDNRVGGWHSYRASKAALNQLIRGASIELQRTHKQAVLIALHPGTVATEFTRDYAGRHPTVAPEVAARNLLTVLDGATPDMTGGFYDYAGETIPW